MFENAKNQGQINVHQLLNHSDLVITLENNASYYDQESSNENENSFDKKK